MQFNPFGKDQTNISRVGLGCWQLGSDWGELDVAEATAILKATVDSGVTFFDTADVYGGGRSEEIIGNFLSQAGLQDEIFVATKLGRLGDLYPDNYTEQGIRSKVEDSLRRLKTDALDLVQLHCIPTEVMRGDEVWAILEKLVAEGKIKRFGASVESMDEALLCIEKAPALTSLQIIFNVFRQKPIRKLFDLAIEKQVGIIARVPLASGLLSGKFSVDTRFGDSDHRNYNKDGEAFNVGETFAGLPFEKGVSLADQLKPLVPEGMNLAQMALRWILDHEAVSVVIPGATRIEQARGNAAIADLPKLSAELHQTLRGFYKSEVRDQIRGPY
ncbi:aldo/keto reductase [Pelagicoccus sp. SDUM812002]|uniref:aldo/keto reductase n=1 Tax=Pelagicoccus sp. SDUM812002 TaxID=3041266 RepID=UPI00280CAA99|nr:aldo/keto reductase [Pelagicoccus sp. SDUM812002]MDQ8188271.1 aldo/keto reductase [Pelagicoccus sp. SDUM812002]